ncbi:MAG: hypothetical protein H0T46_23640 [Deltaproteobacteria bacterium]|nr:hypothetical protein [Deltaproteobacteria bacterium]
MRSTVVVVSFVVVMMLGCSKAKEESAPAAPAPAEGSSDKAPPAAKPAESKPEPPAQPASDPTKPTHPAPSKEAAIARLEEVLAALEAKDWDKVSGMFAFGSDDKPSPEKLEKKLGRLIEIGEISAPGIALLAKSATWGSLIEVMGQEKAEGFARNFKVPVGDCYGFRLEQPDVTTATVGFHWDGSTLRLIRLNNVGKLK